MANWDMISNIMDVDFQVYNLFAKILYHSQSSLSDKVTRKTPK